VRARDLPIAAGAAAPTIPDLQKTLPPGVAIAAFVLGDRRGHVWTNSPGASGLK
jgi:hypothetical protein